MAAQGDSDGERLAALRARIDAIDEAMHRLLMDRGTVIEALIAAKGTQRKRAPFRPQREADMMRRLAARHTGALPLATVEHVWREIITTFTFMQAPFRVVVDYGAEPWAMHDLARFAFGFSVELVPAQDAADVVARVAASGADLGLIPRPEGASAAPWWLGLSADAGPRIMALLPFIAERGRAADAPAFVIAPALADAGPPDLRVVAGLTTRGAAHLERDGGIAILARAPAPSGLHLLLAAGDEATNARLIASGLTDIRTVGGMARGIDADGGEGLLRAALRGRTG